MKSVLLSVLSIVGLSQGALAADPFFLLVTQEVPSQTLVDASHREAQELGAVAAPDVSRRALEAAYPLVFGGGPVGDATTIEGELTAAAEAHYATHFGQAETHFERAFALAYQRPDLLAGDASLLARLADGAALRYRNTLAAGGDTPPAARLKGFVRRFPSQDPTRTEHPPTVLGAWDDVRREVLGTGGTLTVHAEPLTLERSGTCALLVNGAEVGRLPLPGPRSLPRGEHLVQVRCGLQKSWVQRVVVGAAPVVVRAPVRAMLAARAEASTGGVVLTQPSQGDASSLVAAISAAAGFDGAVVVRTAVGRALIGRWERGADDHSVAYEGDLREGDIVAVRRYERGGGGRLWTWVAGGVGLAAVAGGAVANAMYVSEADKLDYDQGKLDSLEGAATGLYVTGGLLLATAVVLFFVEGDDGAEGSARIFAPAPGGVAVRF